MTEQEKIEAFRQWLENVLDKEEDEMANADSYLDEKYSKGFCNAILGSIEEFNRLFPTKSEQEVM